MTDQELGDIAAELAGGPDATDAELLAVLSEVDPQTHQDRISAPTLSLQERLAGRKTPDEWKLPAVVRVHPNGREVKDD